MKKLQRKLQRNDIPLLIFTFLPASKALSLSWWNTKRVESVMVITDVLVAGAGQVVVLLSNG